MSGDVRRALRSGYVGGALGGSPGGAVSASVSAAQKPPAFPAFHLIAQRGLRTKDSGLRTKF